MNFSPEIAGEIVLKLFFLLIILFIALLLHELGHFFAARIFGITVKGVEIGRGRKIFERTDKKGTHWRLGMIPFGAFVNLDVGEGGGFFTKPYWQRALTIAAGPLVNLTLPFILFIGFYLIAGQPSGPPVIAGIARGFPAETAGLKPGDRVLEVNGVPVLNFKDIWEEGYMDGVVKTTFKVQRGEKTFDIVIEPVWADYLDDGIHRANPRFGILWTHTPFQLDVMETVNGEKVEKDVARAREALLRNMDKTILIKMKGVEGEDYDYYFTPRSDANPDMNNPKSKEYKLAYLGPTHDNFYLYQPLSAQFYDAVTYAGGLIGKIAALPFQLLPVDMYAITDADAVGDRKSAAKNHAYSFVHGLAVASVFIGLLNLLPLPYLDGGYIVVQGIEAARRRSMSRKSKALLFGCAFLTIYLSILSANIDNLPHYIDSRLKKVHEFITKIQD